MRQIALFLALCIFGFSVELKEFSYPRLPDIKSPQISPPNINTPKFIPQNPPKDSSHTQKIQDILVHIRESNLQIRSYCLPNTFWSPSPLTATQIKQTAYNLSLSKAQYMGFMDILQESFYTLLQKPIISQDKILNGELTGVGCVIEFWENQPTPQITHFIHIADVIQIDDMFFEKSQIITQTLRKYFCNPSAQP